MGLAGQGFISHYFHNTVKEEDDSEDKQKVKDNSEEESDEEEVEVEEEEEEDNDMVHARKLSGVTLGKKLGNSGHALVYQELVTCSHIKCESPNDCDFL